MNWVMLLVGAVGVAGCVYAAKRARTPEQVAAWLHGATASAAICVTGAVALSQADGGRRLHP